VWWLRLGIQIERIQPGRPQQNGRHERMHLTLKRDATKPAAANVLQQQARFDDFTTRYNTDRPHQAVGMKVPADLYARSRISRPRTADVSLPRSDHHVTSCGRVCFRGRKVNLSQIFAGQSVGVTQVRERIWLVIFNAAIWGISTMRRVGSSRSRTRSDRKCYLFSIRRRNDRR
jgi:putative transposase